MKEQGQRNAGGIALAFYLKQITCEYGINTKKW